jgi:hypothetical protein
MLNSNIAQMLRDGKISDGEKNISNIYKTWGTELRRNTKVLRGEGSRYWISKQFVPRLPIFSRIVRYSTFAEAQGTVGRQGTFGLNLSMNIREASVDRCPSHKSKVQMICFGKRYRHQLMKEKVPPALGGSEGWCILTRPTNVL